ncbi:hypothetical protein V6N13_042142 [Hibiscus sabdariffa]
MHRDACKKSSKQPKSLKKRAGRKCGPTQPLSNADCPSQAISGMGLANPNQKAISLTPPVFGDDQPLKPGDYSSPNTVPALPAQIQAQACRLDLSAELFGGVNDACGHDLDRSRCCPVLAAWLYAAHARYALEVSAPAPAQPEQPMVPDDSQKCVNSLQNALVSKRVKIPQPNVSCDAVICFCGIRLHQISSLSCPAAFNVSGLRNAKPTAAVKNLERDCRNSSYAGCTKCLGALQKVK